MTTNQNSTTTRRTAIRRLIAGMILGAAPLLIAVDTAAAAHADTTVSTPDPSFHSPAHHPASPARTTSPRPGPRPTTITNATAAGESISSALAGDV